MTVNLGGFGPNRHPRMTVGIPGSGLSYQTRLDGPRNRTVQPLAVPPPVFRTAQPLAVPPPGHLLSDWAAARRSAAGLHIGAEPREDQTAQQKARRFFFAAVTILAFVGLIATIVTARSEEQTRIYAPDGRNIGTAVPQGQGSVRYYDFSRQ